MTPTYPVNEAKNLRFDGGVSPLAVTRRNHRDSEQCHFGPSKVQSVRCPIQDRRSMCFPGYTGPDKSRSETDAIAALATIAALGS